ncbi:MAG: HAD-IIB family hydrolase [Calditrichaeota bacterium]|nr:HAD-IIB family hydrolase [Calditrichota bacterium]
MQPLDVAYIVFTDLDGTLLDHHTYSWQAARPGLQIVRKKRIPLIFSTSKTLAEVRELQREMEIRHPVIFENGSGIAVPEGYFRGLPLDHQWDAFRVRLLGPDYETIVNTLNVLRRENGYRFRGFSDCSDEEVARLTGLPVEKARLARQRWSSEPILWEDDARKRLQFEKQLAGQGLRLVRGGRFWHVLGEMAGKGKAALLLKSAYQREWPHRNWRTMGIGDSPNDLDLLQVVDVPILVQRPDGQYIPVPDSLAVVRAPGIGPEGWSWAMVHFLGSEESH